jgi:hypothetical protein
MRKQANAQGARIVLDGHLALAGVAVAGVNIGVRAEDTRGDQKS